MPRIITFYLPDSPENDRLMKNVRRIQEAKKLSLGNVIIPALFEYVEDWMRINERQSTLNEIFSSGNGAEQNPYVSTASTGEQRVQLTEKLLANRKLIANSSDPEREARWKRMLERHATRLKDLEKL